MDRVYLTFHVKRMNTETRTVFVSKGLAKTVNNIIFQQEYAKIVRTGTTSMKSSSAFRNWFALKTLQSMFML